MIYIIQIFRELLINFRLSNMLLNVLHAQHLSGRPTYQWLKITDVESDIGQRILHNIIIKVMQLTMQQHKIAF